MSNGNLFRKTLKRIGYPEADVSDDVDFDNFFNEKELLPFLEIFCSLTEDNVLTTEEIEEYSSLTSNELLEIENFNKSVQIESTFSEIELRNETCYLQEYLSHLENHNKLLEKQMELFKKHEHNLIEEKDSSEKSLAQAKRKFQLYEMNKVPHAIDEFISSLNFILNAVEELETLILHQDTGSSRLPSSDIFKDLVKQYTEDEEKIIQSLGTFLQLEEGTNALSIISKENEQNKEFQKEAIFLQKSLRKTMMNQVISEKEFLKTEASAKYLENIKTSELNSHPLQLKSMFDDAVKINEVLKKKEEELKTYIADVVNKYVNACFADVAVKSTEETLKYIQKCDDTLLPHVDVLVSQRSRLEVLLALLNKHSEDLKNLKLLIQNTCDHILQEQDCLQKRKDNKILNEVLPKENALCPETSIYLSLYRILATFDDPVVENLQSVTLQDVLQKATKFSEEKENMKLREEDNLKVLEVLEEQSTTMQNFLKCSDKEYSNWHELETAANTSLNNLNIKLTLLERNILDCNKDLAQKQKLLESKGNFRLARNLYVYALLNKELFKKCIDDIKVAINESNDA